MEFASKELESNLKWMTEKLILSAFGHSSIREIMYDILSKRKQLELTVWLRIQAVFNILIKISFRRQWLWSTYQETYHWIHPLNSNSWINNALNVLHILDLLNISNFKRKTFYFQTNISKPHPSITECDTKLTS